MKENKKKRFEIPLFILYAIVLAIFIFFVVPDIKESFVNFVNELKGNKFECFPQGWSEINFNPETSENLTNDFKPPLKQVVCYDTTKQHNLICDGWVSEGYNLLPKECMGKIYMSEVKIYS